MQKAYFLSWHVATALLAGIANWLTVALGMDDGAQGTEFIFHGAKRTFHGVQHTFHGVKCTFRAVKYNFASVV